MTFKDLIASCVTLSVVVAVLGQAGCERRAQPASTPAEEMTHSMADLAMPADTTPEAVWAYLQREGYAESWAFWPGRKPLYPGTRPHGALLSTWLNDRAEQGVASIENGDVQARLLPGSMIVKENHAPDSTLASVTVMYRVRDYNPGHGDWFWMKRLPDGTVAASGRVDSCIQCHGMATNTDWLMTAKHDRNPQN